MVKVLEMRAKILFIIINIISAFLWVKCSINPSLAGGSTETTNSKVSGVLYYTDGSPAKYVPVNMRLKNTLADTALYLQKRLPFDSAYTITNSVGFFQIDTIDTGNYIIEADDGRTNLVLIDSITIDNSTSTIKVIDTLKPAGAIQGTIYLSEGGDPRKVFILAFGLNRFNLPNINGSFQFDNLAEANYNLRILPSLEDYGVYDTSVIPVKSGTVINIGTIRVPYIGIPIPKNLNFTYDTLKQIVTLTWSTEDPYNLIEGYNIYRRHIDSNFTNTPINPVLIPDTVFNDSSARQGQTYEYKITVVDTGNKEGKMSSGVMVDITSAFELVDSIGSEGTGDGQFTTIWDMCFDKIGNLYVVSHENNTGNNPRVQKFDANNNFVFGFGQKGIGSSQFMEPTGIAVDGSFNIYIADKGNGRIQKFDSTGNFVLAFAGLITDSSKLEEPRVLAVYNNEIYVADYSINQFFSTVKKFDSEGNFIFQWGKKGDGIGEFEEILSIKLRHSGEIITLDNNRIQIFNPSGVFNKLIELSPYGNLSFDLDIYNSLLYYSDPNGNIIILDESGEFKGKINTKIPEEFKIAINNQNIFASFFSKHKILIYRER